MNVAATQAKKNRQAVAKLKNVPPEILQGLADQENQLAEAQANQKELETHLAEADKAKAQVESDKTDYFDRAQKLADAATGERNSRIKAEKSLSWYRWHWWLSWIIAGAGVLLCIVLAILKFTGRLALKMPLIL